MKYEKTYCSECGNEFGPGDHGYSHCSDHSEKNNDKPVAWMWKYHGFVITAHGKHMAVNTRVDLCRPPEFLINSDDFIELVPLYSKI
jgi:hypothetical protein